MKYRSYLSLTACWLTFWLITKKLITGSIWQKLKGYFFLSLIIENRKGKEKRREGTGRRGEKRRSKCGFVLGYLCRNLVLSLLSPGIQDGGRTVKKNHLNYSSWFVFILSNSNQLFEFYAFIMHSATARLGVDVCLTQTEGKDVPQCPHGKTRGIQTLLKILSGF